MQITNLEPSFYDIRLDDEGAIEYLNERGQRHRLDGPALEYPDGTKVWYQNDKLHREDGPAVEYADGGRTWYVNDEIHRLDGPAVEWGNGDKWWWVHSNFIGDSKDGFTQEDFEKWKKEHGL